MTFLGTGGGRFATIYQVRSTGGLYLKDDVNVHIDPGPSALTNMAKMKMDPAKTDVLLISHCHPDHYSDAEVLLEGMTRGGLKKRGVVAGSRSAIEGTNGIGPAVSEYHKGLPERAMSLSPGDVLNAGKISILATRTKHSDPTGIGFRIKTSSGDISYMSDSELDDSVVNEHAGARVLILALTRPIGSRVANHICTEDAADIASRIRPEMTILTHFGAKLIYNGAGKQAQYIEEHSGVRTIAAEDLMTFTIGRTIRIARRGRPEENETVVPDLPDNGPD